MTLCKYKKKKKKKKKKQNAVTRKFPLHINYTVKLKPGLKFFWFYKFCLGYGYNLGKLKMFKLYIKSVSKSIFKRSRNRVEYGSLILVRV